MLIPLIFGALSLAALPQEKTYAVAGAVLFDDRQPVAHAKVILTGLETTIEKEMITVEDGKYQFSELPAGRYRIQVRLHAHDPIAREFRLGIQPIYRLFFEFRRNDKKVIPLLEIGQQGEVTGPVAEEQEPVEPSSAQPVQIPPSLTPQVSAPQDKPKGEEEDILEPETIQTKPTPTPPMPEPDDKPQPQKPDNTQPKPAPVPHPHDRPDGGAPRQTVNTPPTPLQPVEEPEPEQPPGEASALDFNFSDAMALRGWLATLTNSRLTAIVPLEKGRSLFIVRPALKAPEYSLYRASQKEVLGPAIASRLTEDPNLRFVGVHSLADGRFLLVFSKAVE